jgi:ADP-heptose:LPS heptosyltransferase
VVFYGKIFKAISDKDYDEQLELYISAANKKRAEQFLSRERKFRKHPFVLINPGSDWPSRRWPIEQYAEVVKHLKELFSYLEFGIIGTQGERELAHFIKGNAGEKVFVLSGKTPLEFLPAVMEKASLVITNDSGPAHIARAVGAPVVILAGPSASAYLTIKGRDESVLVQHLVSCAPCLKIACDKMDCWKEITVEEVVDVTKKLIERRTGE